IGRRAAIVPDAFPKFERDFVTYNYAALRLNLPRLAVYRFDRGVAVRGGCRILLYIPPGFLKHVEARHPMRHLNNRLRRFRRERYLDGKLARFRERLNAIEDGC